MTSQPAEMGSRAGNVRIIRDITHVQKGSDLSLAVAFQDSDMRNCRAFIIGPTSTPYQYGFFEFTVKFGPEYPVAPPTVSAITTDRGRTRFNPNIYAEGKVCLSTLGTWRGDQGEGWSPAHSLESVLVSIQSLMSANPYVNEPGFENSDESDSSQASNAADPYGRAYNATQARAYIAKIHHETIRISVLQRVEKYFGIQQCQIGIVEPITKAPDKTAKVSKTLMTTSYKPEDDTWEPFEDLCKRRTLWYYSSYHQSIEDSIKKHGDLVKDGKEFPTMPFEHGGNIMNGTFDYTNLKKRLVKVKELLDAETQRWIEEGAEAVRKESPTALSMQNEVAAMPQYFRERDTTLDFELVDGNPYHWKVIIFGKPMTNLDEGIFDMRVVFSPRFPEEQPRVAIKTPIFHHRVSPDGVLCYTPKKPENIKSHIEAAVEAVIGNTACPDSWTVVNPEASELLWGNEEQKKQYNRRLRRSAQQSSEN